MTIDVAIPLHWQSSRSGQSWTGPSASFHCFCMDIIRLPQICGILCSNDNASANFKAWRPRYRLSVQAQAITLSNAWMVVSISVAMCPIGLPLDTYIRDELDMQHTAMRITKNLLILSASLLPLLHYHRIRFYLRRRPLISPYRKNGPTTSNFIQLVPPSN